MGSIRDTPPARQPLGRIRLGPDDSRSDWSTLLRFSMLFTAGMDIGQGFFGVTEPVLRWAISASERTSPCARHPSISKQIYGPVGHLIDTRSPPRQ